MKSILSTDYFVHFQEESYKALIDYLEKEYLSSLFILVDENTEKHCLPSFLQKSGIENFTLLKVPSGEAYKHINTCSDLWQQLSDGQGDRKSLIINLGGGVITDMGGFVASTFKRGIRFINIPTTLLSMVDASVGGKTGVDLGVLKNQIGLFSNPEMVLIDIEFLTTVPEREIRSGLAEIIKYGFTFDQELWNTIKEFTGVDLSQLTSLVHRSVDIKNRVVLEDMHEGGLRKTLNFGHTIGHAIESYFLENDEKENLTHGEAIAIGMIIELYYSHQILGFPMALCTELKEFVLNFYGRVDLKKEDFLPIIDLLQFDKKNVAGKVNFVLLDALESCQLDRQVTPELLEKGLSYYQS